MLKPFLIVPVLLVAPAFCQDTQPAQAPAQSSAQAPAQTAPAQTAPATGIAAIPAEYLTMTNPVKPTEQSLNRAKQIYGWDCSMCHGDTGNGKGDVAAEQKLATHDFRDSLKTLSDGQMFYIIHSGEGQQMPGEGPRAKTDEVWNLVIYLRKMSGTTAPPASSAIAK
jgi:mono/diheme cytochrome c family protein